MSRYCNFQLIKDKYNKKLIKLKNNLIFFNLFFNIIVSILFICFFMTSDALSDTVSKVQTFNTATANIIPDIKIKNIIIDPGHGGYDKGAKGPDGSLEKNITLALARLIAIQLKDTCTPFITREDDYFLDITSRASFANNNKGDLFISVHTGGSFLHKASGVSIYYLKEMSENIRLFDTASHKIYKDKNSELLWNNLQNYHIASSKKLAELLKKHIAKNISFFDINIKDANILLLQGVDMPAILIETGCIANPFDEKQLLDSNLLTDFAKGIALAIDDFFNKKNQN